MCTIIDYSEKSFALIGEDTKQIKNDLKQLGGRYNPNLTCGKGWIFSNKARERVDNYLVKGLLCVSLNNAIANEVKQTKATKKQTKQTKQAKKQDGIPYCYDEFLTAVNANVNDRNNYYKKYWLPFKMNDGHILAIRKPQIETSFWYGENGGDSYDQARQNCNVMTSSEEAFIDENLRPFDDKVKEINNANSYVALEKWASHPNVVELGNKRNLEAIPLTEEAREDILAILKQERAKFEKRLQTYLKRYGLSKVSARTYWTER